MHRTLVCMCNMGILMFCIDGKLKIYPITGCYLDINDSTSLMCMVFRMLCSNTHVHIKRSMMLIICSLPPVSKGKVE